MSTTVITIPNIQMPFDQLLAIIRQLDRTARVQVARVLAETEMDARLESLIVQLAHQPPTADLSDADIAAEVRSVCQKIG